MASSTYPHRDQEWESPPRREGAEPADLPVSDLVAGIARDTQSIVAGYIDLAKLDFQREVADAKRAVQVIALAVGAMAIGGLLLAFALARALARVAGMPLSATYAIVGGVFVAASGVALYLGWRASREVQLRLQAVDEAKEDLTWIKESV